jgi:hypothetical protein
MRLAVFSLNIKKVIDQHPESKWLALVGSAHLNTYQGIPGICEIVQDAQDLLITDFNIYNTDHSQSLEVHSVPTDIKWTAEKGIPSSGIKASMSLIIDYKSEMSYKAISANKSLRASAEDRSESSSSSAGAAEDRSESSSSSASSSAAAVEDRESEKPRQDKEERTETGGFSLLGKRPAKTPRMPKTEEDKSKKISKPLKEEDGENKGRK